MLLKQQLRSTRRLLPFVKRRKKKSFIFKQQTHQSKNHGHILGLKWPYWCFYTSGVFARPHKGITMTTCGDGQTDILNEDWGFQSSTLWTRFFKRLQRTRTFKSDDFVIWSVAVNLPTTVRPSVITHSTMARLIIAGLTFLHWEDSCAA